MRTIIISADQTVLDKTTVFLRRYGTVVLGAFFTPLDAYECIVSQKPDFIVFDIGSVKDDDNRLIRSFEASVSNVLIIYINSTQLRHPSIVGDNTARFMLQPFSANWESVKTENQAAPDTLTIKCFGKFQIIRNNREIKFVTKKVRELFSFLLCHYNRYICREDIMRALFNSGDRQSDSNNFRVTMHRLRSALEKADISKSQIRIDENYAVHIARGVCDLVDLIDFVQEGKTINEKNIAWAHYIINSIQGELFRDIDTLWLVDIRELIMVQIEELMLSTAQYYMKSANGQEVAERILKRLIDINDVSEASYMTLLDLYIKTSNKAKYTYLYKRYARMLKLELNSVPERKYMRYYISFNK